MPVKPFREGAGEWDALIAGLPNAHVLQSWEWGWVKSQFGWQTQPYYWEDAAGKPCAAALVLARTVNVPLFPAGLRILYVPKGPLLDWRDADLRSTVLKDLVGLAREQKAIFVKIDPDVRLGVGLPGISSEDENSLGRLVCESMSRTGWRMSEEQIQFPNTIVIDLRHELDALLEAMKQKTRYNIRLAERKGVVIRLSQGQDWDQLLAMYAKTADRDGFVIRDEEYYKTLWRTFFEADLLDALIAEVDGQAVAGVIIFRFGRGAWYMTGMSSPLHRDKMPNHLLQWEAIRRARSCGIETYDMWGAPDRMDESDPLWGVYRFKEGFGGQFVRHAGAWDFPIRPASYWMYSKLLPRLLGLMRWRGRGRTHQMAGQA
jgi:lipid II:glycine glycyltransferase (peptidoglycan interpeptide bridge formation enzyme)